MIKEIKNSRFTCHYGVLDPHIQAVYPKSHSTITLSIEDINEAINGLHYASPDHNKIYPYFVKILGPVVSSFNDLNLGWQPEKDKEHVTPHSVSVKVLYRELIATLTTKPLKSKAWEECLQGIPPIDPNKALVASFKSKIFSNQTKANVYKILMKNIWFGEKCKSLNSISHLQWCNACHPKCKCATCDLHNCKCVCHVDPTARNFNTLHHIIFCPFLYPFWSMIHRFALSLSIYFPPETHLLKWSIVSAHMDRFQNQPMILTWQAIYNIYINMIIYHHYFGYKHINIMINTFNDKLIKQLKSDHRTLCKRINANKANAHNSDNEEKNKRLILRFRCTWCHPVLSELSEDLSLQVYYSPEPLISHLKNYSPPSTVISSDP